MRPAVALAVLVCLWRCSGVPLNRALERGDALVTSGRPPVKGFEVQVGLVGGGKVTAELIAAGPEALWLLADGATKLRQILKVDVAWVHVDIPTAATHVEVRAKELGALVPYARFPAGLTDDVRAALDRGSRVPCRDTCAKDGRCVQRRGACVPDSDADCAASAECATFGRCAKAGSACAVTSPEHCRQSAACREDGFCTLRDGACRAVTEDDCRGARVCREDGRCKPIAGLCVVMVGPVEAKD